MYQARITFGTDSGSKLDRESLKDAAESYLYDLCKNGQICGDFVIAWWCGTLAATLYLARPDAFAERHHSASARSSLNDVTKAFGAVPRWENRDDLPPKRFPSWKRSKSLYLFTHFFEPKSPICCGDTGARLPVYLFPLSQHVREWIDSWTRAYVHFDLIWLRSRSLEIDAYKELADPKSKFSKEGRELCAEIESATSIPTYYFLMRYWGRRKLEAVRRCPGCGRKWHESEVPKEKRPYHNFHFRCKACRLVSHCADSDDDERHARIGEFRGHKLTRISGKKSPR